MHYQPDGIAANAIAMVVPQAALVIYRHAVAVAVSPKCFSAAAAQFTATECEPNLADVRAIFDLLRYTGHGDSPFPGAATLVLSREAAAPPLQSSTSPVSLAPHVMTVAFAFGLRGE
jgi:hypothetical protein